MPSPPRRLTPSPKPNVPSPQPVPEEGRRTRIFFFIWLTIIFLSSTDAAGQWANGIYAWLLGPSSAASSSLLHFIAQKSYHIALFAVFGLLLASRHSARSQLLQGVIWSFLVGAISEALQFFSSHRSPATVDVVLNGLSGSLFFWLKIR